MSSTDPTAPVADEAGAAPSDTPLAETPSTETLSPETLSPEAPAPETPAPDLAGTPLPTEASSGGVAEVAANPQAPQSRGKTKGVADIVFMIDVSGSMAPCIDALRQNIETFVDSLSSGDANNAAPVKDWRAKVVGYRDLEAARERRPALDRRQRLRARRRRAQGPARRAAGQWRRRRAGIAARRALQGRHHGGGAQGRAEPWSRTNGATAATRRASSSSSPTPRSRRR